MNKNFSVLFYAMSVFFVCCGFYKMFVYENETGYLISRSTNAYVGGDAYNFIINANYATGFFILALLCALIAATIQITSYLKAISNLQNNNQTGQHELLKHELLKNGE